MSVISRHRTRQPYRTALTVLWMTPHLVMTTILVAHFFNQPERLAGLFDVRYWLPLALTLIPAVYCWREGIDVLDDGVRARIHVPRTIQYTALSGWRRDTHTGIFTIWDRDRRIVFEAHSAHLTDVDKLAAALGQHVERRG